MNDPLARNPWEVNTQMWSPNTLYYMEPISLLNFLIALAYGLDTIPSEVFGELFIYDMTK